MWSTLLEILDPYESADTSRIKNNTKHAKRNKLNIINIIAGLFKTKRG